MIVLSILCALFLAASIYLFIPFYRTRKSIRKYRDQYKSDESRLTPVYTDSLGNVWYQYKTILDMHPMRAMRAEVATRSARLGINEEMFDRYLREMTIALDKQNLTRVGYLIERMTERRLLVGEIETLKGLADAYFLLEGENPKEPSTHFFEKKQEIWKQDNECFAFFLHAAFSILRTTEELSKTDLLSYLQNQATEKALNRL